MELKKILMPIFFLVVGAWLFVFSLKSVDLHQIAIFLVSIFSWKFIFLVLFGFFALIIISALRCLLILKHQGQKPTVKTILSAEMVGFAFSYLTPITFAGGEPFRYIILKEGDNIESSCAISSIIIEKMILFLIMVITFLVGIWFFLIYIPLPYSVQLGLLLFLLIGISVFLFFYYKTKKIIEQKGLFVWILGKLFLSKAKKIRENETQIQEVENKIVKFFCEKTKTRNLVFIISIIETIIGLAFVWSCIHFVSGPMDMGKVFIVNNALSISSFLPLPAALGASEISQSYVFNHLGLTPEKGIVFSLLLRSIFLVFSLFGCIIFGVYQIKELKNKILNIFKK
jgi:uncharacterized protein (TIRG00374 family)